MKCDNCGSKNKPSARFCTNCGTLLIDQNIISDVSSSSPRNRSTVSVKDSIIIGDRATDRDDMEEAQQGIELLRQLKAAKREDAAGYQEIENRSKMTEAKARVMEIEAQQGGGEKKGELKALDILRTVNDLREQSENDEVFNVNLTLNILRKKITDEQSIIHIDTMRKTLETLYDPFSKLKDEHKKQIMSLCTYIEEAYCADLIHGKNEETQLPEDEENTFDETEL
jgi:hypothetical protein